KRLQLLLRLILISLLPFTANGAPTITTAPASQSALVGTNPYFSVVASGTGTLAYQWKQNGATISGGTASTLTFNNVQLSNAGGYTVTVTNTTGAITSATATLTVVAPASSSPPTLPTIPQRTYLVTSYGVISGTADNTTK